MSMKADIDEVFDAMLEKHPALTPDILAAKFGVYEALEWDGAAGDVVREMIDHGLTVDGNMLCYLDSC